VRPKPTRTRVAIPAREGGQKTALRFIGGASTALLSRILEGQRTVQSRSFHIGTAPRPGPADSRQIIADFFPLDL